MLNKSIIRCNQVVKNMNSSVSVGTCDLTSCVSLCSSNDTLEFENSEFLLGLQSISPKLMCVKVLDTITSNVVQGDSASLTMISERVENITSSENSSGKENNLPFRTELQFFTKKAMDGYGVDSVDHSPVHLDKNYIGNVDCLEFNSHPSTFKPSSEINESLNKETQAEDIKTIVPQSGIQEKITGGTDKAHCDRCKNKISGASTLTNPLYHHGKFQHHSCPSCTSIMLSSFGSETVEHCEVGSNEGNLHTNASLCGKGSTKLHLESLYSCSKCVISFMCAESLSRHMELHLIGEPSTLTEVCSLCGEKVRQIDLESHALFHQEKIDNLTKDDNPPRKRNCEKVKSERKWSCGTCEKKFRTSKALREHEVVHTGARDYPCDVCGKAFGTAANMRIHRLTHSDQRPFACLTCGATFRQKDSLKVHARKHTGERPFVCSVCKMTFDRNFTLKNHMLTHASEKSFVCSACGKAFSTRGGLNNHERLHFKDPHQRKERQPRSKPGTGSWVCDECGKIYSSRSNLRMHQRTHEAVQICHECPICSKSYKSRDSMEVHMRRHTEDRPYKCTTCSRSFYRNYTLKLHILTHTGEKPHRCPIEGCTKSFAQSSSLAYHVRNHKKQEERSLNQIKVKRPYNRQKPCLYNNSGEGLKVHSSVNVSNDHLKEYETLSGTGLSDSQDSKVSADPTLQQNIVSNVIVNNIPDTTENILDISCHMSHEIVHQINHSLPSGWDESNSISMIGVMNGLGHVPPNETLADQSVNMEIQSRCQQVQLMQFVPAENLPLLVSVPDNVLYPPDSVEKAMASQNMILTHLP